MEWTKPILHFTLHSSNTKIIFIFNIDLKRRSEHFQSTNYMLSIVLVA